MGDELRPSQRTAGKSTNSTLTARSDYKYTSKALERLEKVVGNVSAGLTMIHNRKHTYPNSSISYAEIPSMGRCYQMRGIRRSIDAQLGEKLYAELPKSMGYDKY